MIMFTTDIGENREEKDIHDSNTYNAYNIYVCVYIFSVFFSVHLDFFPTKLWSLCVFFLIKYILKNKYHLNSENTFILMAL